MNWVKHLKGWFDVIDSKYQTFEVGEIVRVKTWEQMVKEFGTHSNLGYEYVNLERGYFSKKGMSSLCGKKGRIIKIDDDKIRLEPLEGFNLRWNTDLCAEVLEKVW